MSAAYPPVDRCPSPNFGDRRNALTPELVVLHYTGMETAEAALARLCSMEFEVSTHYMIEESGRILSLVHENNRAWHAGEGAWGGAQDVNSRSVGIEIVNNGSVPYTASQMISLEALLPPILDRWAIPPEGVIGHSDLAVGRKSDPGPKFDWRRLALLGLSVWPNTRRRPKVDGGKFLSAAKEFGYSIPERGEFTECLAQVLRAFRLRFLPWAAGPLNEHDMAAMLDLAERFPVRRSLVRTENA